jgi:N-acetylglucosaminyldiphosphoundecaprenol N-acetyl-beta-D-mannosaminyltransferase
MTDNELKLLAEDINSKNTDIVWIGLSTPKQEIFAYRLSKYTNVHFLCTVGAAFDFHIGAVRQAPPVLQKMGLEWLFRLIMEPKRLFGRYLVIVPLFLYYGIFDIITYKINFKKKV